MELSLRRLSRYVALVKERTEHLLTYGQVGDINGRRERFSGMFALLGDLVPKATDVDTKDFYAKAHDGTDILCRWFTKQNSQPPGSAVLYAHGGGMILSNLKEYDPIIKRYVSRTGVPFLAVEFRSAPEFPAPFPVTDCYAGLKYLHEHAVELGVDPKRIAVAGDSGGGGIAAALAHYAKENGGPGICKQVLIYPMLDDRTASIDDGIAPYATWSVDDNVTAWNAVLGDRCGKDGVSPTEAAGRMTVEQAKGLPPAYIDVSRRSRLLSTEIELCV